MSEKKTRLIDSEGKVRKARLVGDKMGTRLMGDPEAVDEKKTRLIVDEKGGKTRLIGDNLRIYLNDDPEVVARYEK